MVLFVGPGLLPGKTLSNADALWFEPPWVGVKPPGLTRPSNAELGDGPRYLLPFLRETSARLPDVALWNPAIVAGRPLHANGQSALFGVYNVPAYILPFWTALGVIGVLKLWVPAFGMFLLARALGLRFGGALLAGIVFALNLRMVTWLSYPAMGVWGFLPWTALLADRVVRRPDLVTGAGLAALAAVQFLVGHAESSFQLLLGTVAFFVLRLWWAHRRDGVGVARPVLVFAAAVAGGAALAAISLVPFLELLWNSADLRDRAGQSVDVHLPTRDVIGLFMPDYWGRPTQTPLRPFLLERAFYVGALPLMLAAAALVLRPRPQRVAIAVFGALCFAVVIGIPPLTQIVTRLPVFSSGHNARLVILTMFAVALLAGWGLDELTASRRAPDVRRRLVLAVAGGLLVLPLVFMVVGRRTSPDVLGDALRAAWLFAEAPLRPENAQHAAVIRLSSLIVWSTLAGAALLLLAARFAGRLGAATFVTLALLLACLDLFRAGMGYNPAIDRERAEVPATPAIRVLQRERVTRFVSTDEIPQNVIPMTYRLAEARGYDLPIVRRFDRLWRREVDPRAASVAAGLLDIPLELREVTARSLRTLRLLGVTHVLRGTTGRAAVPPFTPAAPYPPLRSPALDEIYAGPDARVYRLGGALPRTFVVGAQHVAADEREALDVVTHRTFDARRVAVTERRLDGIAEARVAPRAEVAGRSRIVRSEDERVVIHARATRPALVVLADTHYPGWTAEVDGREVPVERVDYLFRGVRVGPGAHTVELRYEPLSWRIGWMVSVAALLGLALAVVGGLRGRRTRTESDGGRARDPRPVAAEQRVG